MLWPRESHIRVTSKATAPAWRLVRKTSPPKSTRPSTVSMCGNWQAHPLKSTVWPLESARSRSRSRAPAHAWQPVSTPAQERPYPCVATGTRGNSEERPLNAPAPCVCARQLVSAPAQEQYAPVLKGPRSALYPCAATGKRIRSFSAASMCGAQRCIQAWRLVSAPAQECPLSSTYARQLVSAPTQEHQLSTVAMRQLISAPAQEQCIHVWQLVSAWHFCIEDQIPAERFAWAKSVL